MPKSCILWPGCKNRQGYGMCWKGKKWYLAHRIAWESANGTIPERLCVLHRCDNPPCVNINHLFLGNRTDNHLDKVNKGRMLTGMSLPQTRLTTKQVADIRHSTLNQVQLAEKYDVSQSHISRIKNNIRRRG